MMNRNDLIEMYSIWVKPDFLSTEAIASRCADEAIRFAKEYHKKQLTLTSVGCSVIAEPYLISEKENQIEEMKKLGLFTEGILFEQSVNGLIQVVKDLKEL